MTWELYEVWQEDENGHEGIIDTTKSLKEALELAKTMLSETEGTVHIYRESEDDYKKVKTLTIDDGGTIITV